MLKLGLTGGIGSGKTTVLQVFASLGVPCFVADDVAKGYYQDTSFLKHVAEVFGHEILNPDFTLNRQALARIVFSDSRRLEQLNQLIHPRVASDFRRWCGERENNDVVLLESAILYESGFDSLVDKVVEVYLDKEERIFRTQLRDKSSREDVLSRMASQISDEDKLMRSDYVVLNYEGNPRERQVRHILSLLANDQHL